MNVGSVASSLVTSTPPVKQPEATEVKAKGNDRDTDDSSNTVQPKPVVNTSGQLTGTNLNVTA